MRADKRQLGTGEGRFDHAAGENTEIDIARNDGLCCSGSPFDKNRKNFNPMFGKKSEIMRHPERRECAAKAWEYDFERLCLRCRIIGRQQSKNDADKKRI